MLLKYIGNVEINVKKRIVSLSILLLALAFITLGVLYVLTGFQFGGNDNNSITETVPSPDGKYIAYVFVRDMGATTQASYQLSILAEGQELGNAAGNAYISYNEFGIEWVSEKELLVDNQVSEIFKQKDEVKGITIIYSYQK
jgi:hypothetical protein